ncbi:N-acetyl sugar amidotransferase [Cloacibacillus sp.]
MNNLEYRICTNCIMDTSDPQIRFDKNGHCDFCDNYYNTILPSWHPDEQGSKELLNISDKIRRDTADKKYNCIIGMSGGTDSSYLTYVVKEKLSLNPLLVSVDTGWNLNVANNNVDNLVKKLGLDIVTLTINWEEMKDLQLAFFKSAVPYQDTPQDTAIFSALCNYAAKNGFKYVMTGGNNSTECVKPPQEWTYYNDVKLLRDIHRCFGTRPLKEFPLCSMFKYRIWYRYFKGIKVVKPLNYVDYRKDAATVLLSDRFGWEQYANKHYEDRFTRFYEGWWLPRKFGYDKRRCYFSSLILTGQMTRDEALKEIAEQPYDEGIAQEDMEFICDKLGITTIELMEFFRLPNKTFRDYKNSFGMINKAIKLAMLLGIEKRNFRK